MGLKEILETEGLKNVQVHPFFDNLEKQEEANIDEIFTRQNELPLLQYDNGILSVSVCLRYKDGSYILPGSITTKSGDEDPFVMGAVYNDNFDIIRQQSIKQLTNFGIKTEKIDSGISFGNDRVILSTGDMQIYSSNRYFEPNTVLMDHWKKLLVQEFSVASIGLLVMYDMINKVIYNQDSNVCEKFYGYISKHFNDYTNSLQVSILKTQNVSSSSGKAINIINKGLYKSSKERIIQ